jgi:VCBS repeat-containing protein
VNALPPAPGLPTSNVGIKNDAVVAKLTPDGGALVYSTFVGGGMPEVLHDIALDGNGHAYITGVTYSGTYPVVGGVDSTCGCVDGFFEGIPDAFVAKLFLTNAAPVAVADAQATDEDVELAVPAPGVLANDTDVNPQDVLTAILVTPPQHGSLALAADGSFTYTPAADFNGTDAFSYTASDGELESGPATVTITVNGTNDAPLADAGGPYIVDEGGTQTLSGTGIDPEGGTLTFDWDLDGDGEFDDATGPSPAYNAGNGPATITVALRVTDGQGASAVDTAAIEIRNVPPVALADACTTQVGVPLTVPAPGVLANDTDFDPLSAVLVGGPTQGTLTLRADGSFDYAANPGAGGTDTFTYRASDGVAQSAPATVTITLTAPQGLPDAVNDTFVIKKRRHRPHVLNVLGNDSSGPGGGSLRIVGVTQPDHGQVRISRNGRVVIFQAPRRFRGVVTFNYTVRNANNLADTATVTVHVRRNGPHGDDHDGD